MILHLEKNFMETSWYGKYLKSLHFLYERIWIYRGPVSNMEILSTGVGFLQLLGIYIPLCRVIPMMNGFFHDSYTTTGVHGMTKSI